MPRNETCVWTMNMQFRFLWHTLQSPSYRLLVQYKPLCTISTLCETDNSSYFSREKCLNVFFFVIWAFMKDLCHAQIAISWMTCLICQFLHAFLDCDTGNRHLSQAFRMHVYNYHCTLLHSLPPPPPFFCTEGLISQHPPSSIPGQKAHLLPAWPPIGQPFWRREFLGLLLAEKKRLWRQLRRSQCRGGERKRTNGSWVFEIKLENEQADKL